MGLPLFVAPVESDLPSKSASKHGITSPPRSSIRHSGSAWRDQRIPNMRRAALRLYGDPSLSIPPDAQIDSNDRSSQPRRSHGPSEGELFSAAAANIAAAWGDPSPASQRVNQNRNMPSHVREALLNANSMGEPNRARLQEFLHASLRASERLDNERGRPPEYLGLFTVEPDDPSAAPQRRAAPSRRLPHFVHTAAGPRAPNEASSQAPTSQDSSTGANTEQPRRPAVLNRIPRRVARITRNHMPRRNPPRRGVDGLGDRDRSLSPEVEVWDTLLSTLTPDPQPPSASSSFASAAASQTAAPSSTTTPSPANANPTAEPPCDSGCENSDGEDSPFSRAAERLPGAQTRALPSGERFTVFHMDTSSDRHPARRAQRNGRPASAPRPVDAPSTHTGNALRDRPTGQPGGAVPLSRILHPAPRDGWVGRLSVGASDEEQGDDGARQNREGSDGQNASGGDEDLSGMQRIIRSLSWREDIPEEWWAEAGLRRTLPPDTEFT